jgi:hypothetical protein
MEAENSFKKFAKSKIKIDLETCKFKIIYIVDA